MRSVQMLKMTKVGVLLLAALLLAGLATLTTGCNDGGETDMYAQISAGSRSEGSAATTTAGTSAAGDAAAAQPGAAVNTPAGDQPGLNLPGAEGAAVEAGETVGEEGEDLTLIDCVEVENLSVKAPYPEFTGEGRYNVRITCMTTELVDGQVFRIVAVGEDGSVVGEQNRHLKLPTKKARTFNLDDFYCMSIPVAIEFHTTDVEAAASTGENGSRISAPGSGSGNGGSGGSGDAGSNAAGLN